MVEADAVTRIWHAIEWMQSPHLITAGRQGPLHLYLLALSIWIGKDILLGPIVMHILFSVGTAVVLYLFTRVEFESENGSLLVGLAFSLYPVAVRNSLSAMPESIFVFLMALTIYFLARGFRQPGTYSFEFMAGVSLTLAGMIRYEGWEFIPLLGILLIRDWRKMFVFGFFAALFPISWLLGNQIEYGNAMYAMQWSSNWELNVVGANEGLTTRDYIERVVYYPLVLILGLTPLAALGVFWGAGRALWKRQRTARWLVPVAGLLAAMTYFAYQGSLDTQARYTISLGMFLLPYLAVVYDNWRLDGKWKQIIFGLFLVLMLPLGYLGNPVSPLENFYVAGINPLPRLRTDSQEMTADVLAVLDAQIEQKEIGLISDFFSYRETYYVMGETRLNPWAIFVAPGEKHEEVVEAELLEVLEKYPEGVLILVEKSNFSTIFTTAPDGYLEVFGVSLNVQPLDTVHGPVNSLLIYEYQVR
jgi:4-amino-4-deoxy-L-arabinose transferase-like glycosyltransferase